MNADELLAWMNARTDIAASRSARKRLEHYLTPSGDLRRPVLTMHGVFDAMLPVSHQAVYRALVDAAGNGDNLVQTYVYGGHDTFSAEQYLAALGSHGALARHRNPPGRLVLPGEHRIRQRLRAAALAVLGLLHGEHVRRDRAPIPGIPWHRCSVSSLRASSPSTTYSIYLPNQDALGDDPPVAGGTATLVKKRVPLG